MNPRILLRKESTKNSASMSTDHSISDQDFQCKELLKLMETTTSHSTDGILQERTNSNGGSMEFPRQSEINTGRTIAWKSHQKEVPMNLESLVQSPQDGGKCSDSMVPTLPTREER